MYKKQIITLLALGLISAQVFFACGNSTADPTPPKSKNPNGDSELAIVMRQMMEFSKKLKSEIETKNQTLPIPPEIQNILTAKETPGMIKDRAAYSGFAKYYLSTLDSVYLPNADLKHRFNSTVNSCISCHSEYCQGPIPAIKKLEIRN